MFKKAFNEGIKKGKFEKVNIDIASGALLSIVKGFEIENLIRTDKKTLAKELDALINMVLNGKVK